MERREARPNAARRRGRGCAQGGGRIEAVCAQRATVCAQGAVCTLSATRTFRAQPGPPPEDPRALGKRTERVFARRAHSAPISAFLISAWALSGSRVDPPPSPSTTLLVDTRVYMYVLCVVVVCGTCSRLGCRVGGVTYATIPNQSTKRHKEDFA